MVLTHPTTIFAEGAFHDWESAFDRLTQPFHGELDILRLKVSPAFDLCLIPILWVAAEILHGQLPGGRALPGELLADERVLGHAQLKRGPVQLANHA
jgi:hypothetical protein